MLVKVGVVFLVCMVIAFIYIIKVIGRDFDAPIKAAKNYLQTKPKKIINNESIKNLPKPYSPSIARYVLSIVFLLLLFESTGLGGINILLVLPAVPLVFIAAMPYRNKIEMGKLRFTICCITILLMWFLMFLIQNNSLYIPNPELSFFILYWVAMILSYYCCVHTYKSWFFLLIFWIGPWVFFPFFDDSNDVFWILIGHIVGPFPSSFIGMRVLVEIYYWFKNKRIKSSKNA